MYGAQGQDGPSGGARPVQYMQHCLAGHGCRRCDMCCKVCVVCGAAAGLVFTRRP